MLLHIVSTQALVRIMMELNNVSILYLWLSWTGGIQTPELCTNGYYIILSREDNRAYRTHIRLWIGSRQTDAQHSVACVLNYGYIVRERTCIKIKIKKMDWFVSQRLEWHITRKFQGQWRSKLSQIVFEYRQLLIEGRWNMHCVGLILWK